MVRSRYAIFVAVTLLLSLVALLAGCAAERTVMTLDPGLTPAALDEGGVAIAGVTMVDEVEQIRPPLNETLMRVLDASHPEIHFLSADSVKQRLGPGAAREILFRFQQKGDLDEVARASLGKALAPGSRYALFARIEKSSIHPPTRPPGTFRYAMSWTSRRDALVRFTLYDLRDGKIAMDAIYASSSENALSDSASQRPLPRDKPTVYEPGVNNPSAPDFAPETPSLAYAIIEACRAFAADLPRTGSPPVPPVR